jgi:hypothetical protein
MALFLQLSLTFFDFLFEFVYHVVNTVTVKMNTFEEPIQGGFPRELYSYGSRTEQPR